MPPHYSDTRRVFAAASVSHHGIDSYLYDILLDVMSFTAKINQGENLSVFDTSTYYEVLLSVCCRLIRFQPLDTPRHGSHIETVYHIGLTIFMMTLFLQHDARRVIHFPLVSRHLKEVLLCEPFHEDDNGLFIWVMFIGGIWILPDPDESWLLSKLRDLVRQLKIKDYQGVLQYIDDFPWINGMHDELGQSIWDMVMQEF
jgi:hypothetical protein